MKKWLVISIVLVLLVAGGGYVAAKKYLFSPSTTPIPTLAPLTQLTPDQYPKVSLEFTKDGRYVTVNITNIHADKLEYNLIYDATVKGNRIQTGVSASANMDGKSDYSRQQLLGSESSGHFTYHENIQNAVLELTLRDPAARSVYSASFPFTYSPGQTQSLNPQ